MIEVWAFLSVSLIIQESFNTLPIAYHAVDVLYYLPTEITTTASNLNSELITFFSTLKDLHNSSGMPRRQYGLTFHYITGYKFSPLRKTCIVEFQIFVVQKFRESLEIYLKQFFCDKNFVITSTFHDCVLRYPFFRYKLSHV